MENLIMKSFLDYPKQMEDFLEVALQALRFLIKKSLKLYWR